MKTALIAGLLVLVALWAGYYRGYHNGVQTERRAWELTAQVDKSIVTLDDNHHPDPIRYRNPHSGIIVVNSQGKRQVNVPDLRNSPVQ